MRAVQPTGGGVTAFLSLALLSLKITTLPAFRAGQGRPPTAGVTVLTASSWALGDPRQPSSAIGAPRSGAEIRGGEPIRMTNIRT